MIYFNYTRTITYMQHTAKYNLKELGKHIKALREKTGKSLNSFVLEKGGITSATLSRIENGLVDVRLNTLIKISALLDVNISELLSGVNFDYTIEDE